MNSQLAIHSDTHTPPQSAQGSFSAIELFAGAGGLALGIEKAGFDTLAFIEYDKDAAATLKKIARHGMLFVMILQMFHRKTLPRFSGWPPVNWIFFQAGLPANHFLMRATVLV